MTYPTDATVADLPTAAPPSPALAELIGNRWTLQQVATALGCTERSVYLLIEKQRVPYIRVLSRRYVDPKDLREALLRDSANPPSRGRGRPRKIAQ